MVQNTHHDAGTGNGGQSNGSPETDFVSNTETVAHIACSVACGVVAIIGRCIVNRSGSLVRSVIFFIFVFAVRIVFVTFFFVARACGGNGSGNGFFFFSSGSVALQGHRRTVNKDNRCRKTRSVNSLAIEVDLLDILISGHTATFIELSRNELGIVNAIGSQSCHRGKVTLATLIELVRGFGFTKRIFELLTDDQAAFLERFDFICRSDLKRSAKFGNDIVIRCARILCGKFFNIVYASKSRYDRQAENHQK